MKHISFSSKNCSLAKSLDLLGEWWTLTILQEALFGTKRFNDFQKNLGIAKNILSTRLEHLVSHDFLKKEIKNSINKRPQYKLTDKGKSVATIIVTLIQWGDEWTNQEDGAPIILKDINTKEHIAKINISSKSGTKLEVSDLLVQSGPGANEKTKKRFNQNLNLENNVKWRVRNKI